MIIGSLQEILRSGVAGGNKQFASDLMFDLDEDQDGKVPSSLCVALHSGYSSQITMEEWLNYWAKQLVHFPAFAPTCSFVSINDTE